MPLQKELFASSRKGRSISPLSPFPPVQPQTHEPTLRVPSSARSAMFIVTPTPDAQAKLLWERHEWRFASHSPSVVGPSTRTHAAPLELGQASRVGVTINMALLTELSPSPSLKIRIIPKRTRRATARCAPSSPQMQKWRHEHAHTGTLLHSNPHRLACELHGIR